MKKENTYRRFNLIAFLALLGCIGMLAFEGFFIFEIYDRIALQTESMDPVESGMQAIPENHSNESVVAPGQAGSVPVKKEGVVPVAKEPSKPAAAPVDVKPAAPVTPAVLPVDDSPGISVEPIKEQPVEDNAALVDVPSATVSPGPVIILK